jgi:PQQ-dependent dehydrogenase (methanol/ethanol family)
MNANGQWSRRRMLVGLATVAVVAIAAVASLAPASGHAQSDEGVDWPTVNNTLDGQRYSTLTDINTANVKNLKVAWRFRAKAVGAESYPVVVGRTAYVTTTFGVLYALDAVTGKELWKFDPRPLKNGKVGGEAGAAVHGFPNRGVAVGDGRVYGITPNALLYALDPAGGRLVWKTSLGDPLFLSESAAPIFFDGMLFVGSAGSEAGARGFEAAYDAKTGKQIWRHYTIPPANAPGSWVKGHHGGGDVWMNATIDPKAGRLYIATGNPGSDFDPRVRAGRNLWTNSILALDPKTGKQIWGYQLEHHDVWDFDSTSPPVLFPTTSGLAVGEANKGGFWHEVAATTGKRLTKPVAFVYQHRVVAKPGGPAVVTWPGFFGGSEWSPVPFSPQTGLVYVSGLNVPIKITVPKKVPAYSNGLDVGGTADVTGAWTKKYPLAGTGTFTAIDVNAGTIRWQTKEPVAMVGGSTTTAGGLVFVGVSGKGAFQALDAKTGAVLWQHSLGGRIDDAASVYSINGKEYVLIASGGSSLGGPGWGGMEVPSPATFTAFALGTTGAARALPAPAGARSNSLIGTDGPGFTITMNKTTVKAGTYTIVIRDMSSIHNFHLFGSGVNKPTSVPAIGTTRWTVKLKKGIYRFQCDPHAAIMNGRLTVT